MRPPHLIRRIRGAKGGLLAMAQTLLAQGLTMAVNLATGIITARLLGPVGRGEFAAAGIWLLLPSLLATAGIQNAIVYVMRQRPNEALPVGLASLGLATAAFLPMLAACLFLLPTFMHAYPASILALARVALLLSVLNVWMVMARQWLLGLQLFAWFNAVICGVALTYLGLLLGLAALHMVTPRLALLAQIGSTGLVLIAILPRLLWSTRGGIVRMGALADMLLRYGTKAAPADLVTVLSQNVDRLVLVALVSAAEFGIYVVAMSFARILSVLQTAIGAVMLADLAGSPPARIEQAVHTGFRVLLWALVVLCAVLMLFDARLLALVYGPGFAAAAPIFRLLLLDAALTCLAQVLTQGFLVIGAPGLPSTIQVVVFCATSTGVVAAAPAFGAIGAAAVLATGSLLRLALLFAALPTAGLRRPGLAPKPADLDPLTRRWRRADA